jgi:predicted dehydrogenase
LGSIGRRHLRNLKALGEEDIVLYRTGKSTLPDDELGQFPVEHDLEQAFARWKPDGTIIANPTSSHMNIAIAAGEAGSHLFIEKPISDTLDGVHELRKLIEKNVLKALVGFQFRFHPVLQHVKNLLDDKALGEVLSANVEWGEYLPNWHPWEDYRNSYSARRDLGGGVVLTLSHPFDYLRWLLGEVNQVTAETGNTGQLDLDVEDTADIILRFEAEYFASVHLDYLQRPDIHRLKIIGSEGTLLWDNADGSVRWWSSDSNEWPTLTVPKGFERNQLFLDEMEHFIQILSGEAAPQCSLEDGIQALEIALAVHKSSMLGERVEL